jgi:hypothetical protein
VKTDNANTETPIAPAEVRDVEKDTQRGIIRTLLRHAREDARLAELTASNARYWHTADDCHNIGIAIEKSLASMEG